MSTRHLMIWAVLAAAALACGPARPACAGLVGLYTFEGNVNDVSGNGYDATTVNNVSYAPGYEGQAGVFDGSTSFADLPFAISRVFAPSVTIGAWVNAAAITPPPNTRHQILSGDSGGYGRSLTIDSRGFGGGDTGVSSYSAFAGSTGVLPGSAASPFQGWVFVAATYQGAERVVRLQVGDQTFVRTMAGTGGTANPLRIGALPVGAEFFNGQIDNAFVFSGALSASQLKTIRDNGATGIQQVAASLAGPPTSYQAAVQSEPSLISYYTFDNDSVATGVQDVAPVNPHDSTSITGTPVFGPGFDGGKAAMFDGTSQVNFGVVSDFDFADGSGTVEAWILHAPVGGANRGYLGNRADGAPSRYSLHTSPGSDLIVSYSDGNCCGTFDKDSATRWMHTAAVWDNGAVRYYIDGDLVGTFNLNLGSTGHPFQIGNSVPTPGGESWIGGLDEVAIYEDALSAAAIQGHVYATRPPLARQYDFESGTLDGWQVVPGYGTALDNQPTNSTRSAFNKQGQWFIGLYEGNADGPTGILESESFVLGPDALIQFLVGGGDHPWIGTPDAPAADVTAVNLEYLDGGAWQVAFTTTGLNREDMAPVVWDASALAGRLVRFRIYDTASGGWGHINADDFRVFQGVVVPEPATLVLFGLGLIGLAACGWRRRNSRSLG